MGAKLDLSVVASNATGYQWKKSATKTGTFTDVQGATSATYSVAAAAASDAGWYMVTVTGPGGSKDSTPVEITVA